MEESRLPTEISQQQYVLHTMLPTNTCDTHKYRTVGLLQDLTYIRVRKDKRDTSTAVVIKRSFAGCTRLP